MSTRRRGEISERLAERHLERAGLTILERNVIEGGVELDLIALDPRPGEYTYVFVEVRSREDDLRGDPLETIGPRKRARLVRGATAYLVARGLWERVPVRFDVVSIVAPDADSPAIKWVEHAFEA